MEKEIVIHKITNGKYIALWTPTQEEGWKRWNFFCTDPDLIEQFYDDGRPYIYIGYYDTGRKDFTKPNSESQDFEDDNDFYDLQAEVYKQAVSYEEWSDLMNMWNA